MFIGPDCIVRGHPKIHLQSVIGIGPLREEEVFIKTRLIDHRWWNFRNLMCCLTNFDHFSNEEVQAIPCLCIKSHAGHPDGFLTTT